MERNAEIMYRPSRARSGIGSVAARARCAGETDPGQNVQLAVIVRAVDARRDKAFDSGCGRPNDESRGWHTLTGIRAECVTSKITPAGPGTLVLRGCSERPIPSNAKASGSPRGREICVLPDAIGRGVQRRRRETHHRSEEPDERNGVRL